MAELVEVGEADFVGKGVFVLLGEVPEVAEEEENSGGDVVVVAAILTVGTADEKAEDVGLKLFAEDRERGVLRVGDGEFFGEGVQGFRQLGAHRGDDAGGEVGEGSGRHNNASAMKPGKGGNVITGVGCDFRDAAKCAMKSIMKTQKLRRLFLCAGLALLGAVLVSAQPNGGGQGQGAGQGQGQGPGKGPSGKQGEGQGANPGERLQQLVQHLELTPAQVEQLRPIMVANMQEMRSLRQDGALQGKALREKAQALREENRLAVRAILTPEQQAKFDAMPQRGPGGPQATKQVN